MKNVKFHHVAIFFCLIILFSCKKDSGIKPCSTAWALDLQHELSAITVAITAYSLDKSDANCIAVKAAYQGYVDAMRPYGNCATLTGQARTDWQKSMDDAEEDIDDWC